MKNIVCVLSFLLLVLVFVKCKDKTSDVNLEVQISPKEGWMNGGYGILKFKFINNSDENIMTGEVDGTWHVGGKMFNNWKYSPNLTLLSGEEKVGDLIAWMPPQTEELSRGSVPRIEGSAIVIKGMEKIKIPFSIEVPVAKLASPLVSRRGKNIELIFQEKTWADVKYPEKIIAYLDDVYTAMYELTGYRPFNGNYISLKECPRNPYFSYAGNPIILNGEFVARSVNSFDNDEIDFGWVHEIGQDFSDEMDLFYNNDVFTKMQANIKLSYVLDKLCTNESKLKIKSLVDKKTLVTGKVFNDEYFGTKGQNYLHDTTRSWKSLESDEYHALFLKVIRRHDWEIMKKFYRVFIKLNENRVNPPEGVDRIILSLVVFDKCCDEDLVPLYKEWRLPVDYKVISEVSKKYQLDLIFK